MNATERMLALLSEKLHKRAGEFESDARRLNGKGFTERSEELRAIADNIRIIAKELAG